MIDRRLIQLARDPVRLQIVTLLNERTAGAGEVAEELGMGTSAAGRHLEEMHDAGLIEVVGEVLNRGAVEPRYRALVRALWDDEEWATFSDEERKRLSTWIIDMIDADVRDAVEQGTFTTRQDSHASRTIPLVDEQGWRELCCGSTQTPCRRSSRSKQQAPNALPRAARTASRPCRRCSAASCRPAARSRQTSGSAARAGGLLALQLVELDLAQADRLRRHFDALVLAQELDRGFQREACGRRHALQHVGAGGAHVGLLLFLGRVDVHVLGAGVLADDHPLVDLLAGADEERAAVLDADQRVAGGLAAAVGDDRAGWAQAQLARPALPALEDVVHDPGAAGLGEELGAEADQAARRHQVFHPHPAGVVVGHLLQAALATRQQLRDRADVLLGGVDREPLDRLVQLAVDLLRQHAGLPSGQLEALAAHQLEQDDQLQLAAALHLPGIGALGVVDADRDVADQLGVEAVADLAGGQLAALGAGQGGGVDPEHDRERGLVDRDHRQRPRIGRVGQGLADRHLFHPGDGDDLARPGLLGGDPLQRLGDVELGDRGPLDRAVGPAPGDLLAGADRAVVDPAKRQAADVGRGVEVGHVRLQRVVGVVLGRRDLLQHQVHQRGEVGALDALLQRGPAGLGVGVDDREVDLLGVGVEVEEELVDLVDDLGDAGVGAVDLVDDEDHRQLCLQRLAQDEAGLGQRSLGGVDEQQHAVDHGQAALDLAAEIGVAGGVDDVELHPVVVDGGVLGEDRDALLALEVHRVHHPLGHVLALAEGAGLPEHRVDQRRLAVVDVGDDCDISQVVSSSHKWGSNGEVQCAVRNCPNLATKTGPALRRAP